MKRAEKSSERRNRLRLCRDDLQRPWREPDAGTDRIGVALRSRAATNDLVPGIEGASVLSGVMFLDGRAIGILAGNGRVVQLTQGR